MTYLDTATYGLPPQATVQALRACADAWAAGTARWVDDWDRHGDACRDLAASLLGTPPADVSLMPAVSVATGLVATAVPDGAEVLVADRDFASLAWPFLELQRRGRLRVRAVPLEAIAESIGRHTRLVAVSHVQSADGAQVELAGLTAAAREVGARVLVDATQSLGVLPMHPTELGVDAVVAAAYKWLCCPRGVGFLYAHPALRAEMMAVTASWRGSVEPYARYYGVPATLAPDGRGFDVSLAWHAWVGARYALEALLRIPQSERERRAVGVASALADHLGVPRPPGAILALDVAPGAEDALEEAGVRASWRAGRIRLSPHFYNTPADAQRAGDALAPYVRRKGASI